MRCFCVKKPITEQSQSLYHFPLGNVYTDGRICWGSRRSKKLPTSITLANIGAFVDAFFSSTFNTDLRINLSDTGYKLVGYSSAASVARYIDGKKQFPIEILRKANEITGQYINRFDKAK